MGIFKRKEKEAENEFAQEQKISGGNLFEVKQKMIAQRAIDYSNMEVTNNLTDIFSNFEIQEYYLLQLQANYFINTINYEIDDMNIFSKIKDMLRCAFINGKSGMRYDKLIDKWVVYYIADIEYTTYGDIKKYKVIPWNSVSHFTTIEEYKNYNGLKEEYEDIILFKWGSYGLSAWLYIWPFIKYQSNLLTMIQTDSFSYIRKFVYNIVDPTQTRSELDAWFNPKNPFVLKNKNLDISNKFKVSDLSNPTSSKDIIQIYKDVCGVYYSLFGRRWNNDYKKERSITIESELTTDNYDVLEKDWLDQFKIFVYNFNKISDKKITIIEKGEEYVDERFSEQQEDGII